MADVNKNKKKTDPAQVGIAVFALILAALIIIMMQIVSSIQGTARVVNYAGLVRGKTQRIVKLEIAEQPQDEMIASVDSFINGLRFGDDSLNLVSLNDSSFQNKMTELDEYFKSLKEVILRVRKCGYKNTDIIYKSEHFFNICDEATGLAEMYSQRKASDLQLLEKFITADIVCLMLLIAFELFKALRYAALNRALQSKVYIDAATGLPNKNKCEELLKSGDAVEALTGVCSFDLNNLRRINNSMGHEKGDEYIRRFAVALRQAVPAEHFVGRAGGDEFMAVTHGLDDMSMRQLLREIRSKIHDYSERYDDFPLSYAEGYAVADAEQTATLRELYNSADKNMYINKNHVKRDEAQFEKRQDAELLKLLGNSGSSYSDCIYCDARLDTYRAIRTSDDFFLASDGNYSSAVEQIADEHTAEEDRDRLKEQLSLDALCSGLSDSHRIIETERFKDSGSSLYRHISAVYVDSDADGKLHHFLIAFELLHNDETGMPNAKQQLSQYYEQLKQSVIENSSYVDALLDTADAIYSVDLNDDVIEQSFINKDKEDLSRSMFVNCDFPCSYTKYCSEYAKNVTPDTVESYRMTDSSEKLLRRFESESKQFTVEYCINTASGCKWMQKTMLMSEHAMYNAADDSVHSLRQALILLKDTTQFHALEHEEQARLRAAFDEANAANKAKTEFLNRMSHDIRTPINGIMGMLEIIHKNRHDERKVDDCLDKIHVSSEHLLALINDVLDMSKLESGKITLENESFDLEKFLKQMKALCDAFLSDSTVTYRSHAGELKHTALIGSPLRLRQILINLFSNAVKYNREYGSIDTYVEELSCSSGKAVYEFRISDTGIGMSEEFISNKLFRPFTQEHSDARTQYHGTGLGMSIVKELTDLMGGSIAVESKPGAGTTFTVTLCFDIDVPHDLPALPDDKKGSQRSLKGLRALLAEDNDINMEIAEFFLDDLGLKVTEARNGREAVEIFASSEPGSFDVIFMDIMMPEMDGIEAAKRIRAMNRPDAGSVVIIAMTANAFSDDVERSRRAGMNEHISKPLKEEMIREALLKQL